MSILNFFNKIRESRNNVNLRYCCLIDCNTNGLLVVGKSSQCMNFLREYTLDTILIDLPPSNKYEESFFSSLEESDCCYLLQWDFNNKKFIRNKNSSEFLIKKSILSKIKYTTLENVMSSIISLRNSIKKTLPYQETIYLTKKYQAERFKDRGCPESEMLDYPYVLQYADFKKISLRDAADRILLKAKIEDELLAKTELLRLKYFNEIREAASKVDVEELYNRFLLDFNIKI